MLERFKDADKLQTRQSAGKMPRMTGSDELPFDLELTRRVNGQYMPTKWGTRDPGDALVPVADTHYELHQAADGTLMPAAQMVAMYGHDAGSWDDLVQVSLGHGAGSALNAQTRLAKGDKDVLRVIDDLRTQLLQTLQSEVWNRIAVTSPTSGCGATFTAINLALSISRIPESRTVLMDLNQRNPSISRMLDVRGPGDMYRFLAGQVTAEDHLVRCSDTLALGLNRARPVNPSEVLHAKRTGDVLDDMIGTLRPDVVLYDLPPLLEYDDCTAFLPQVDGVLLVVDATQTLGSQIAECERRLEGKAKLLGVILNRTRPAKPHAKAA
ncbi:CpsD/CapB family tyrosine-protein kinase [Rhodobacteraceae bacterium KMM 6894]|nr:CpsD/CapB family tyrosine-protein kinase [Rhodobacteraceae bacterium KMM 6894]